MNNAQFKGSWNEFKGELKKKWGQFTDDDLLEAEGDYDKFLGVVQKRYGEKKEEVSNWAHDWYSNREREGDPTKAGDDIAQPDVAAVILPPHPAAARAAAHLHEY